MLISRPAPAADPRAMGRDTHGKLLATNAALQSQGGIKGAHSDADNGTAT